jgi:Ca2+-binding EF-hand superfamily protein
MKELAKALYETEMHISEKDVVTLFEYMDHRRDNRICIDPLLQLLRGPISTFRQDVVSHLFCKLDFDGRGFLRLDEFKNFYSAKSHPLVKSGVKRESQIIDELIQSFEDYLTILV